MSARLLPVIVVLTLALALVAGATSASAQNNSAISSGAADATSKVVLDPLGNPNTGNTELAVGSCMVDRQNAPAVIVPEDVQAQARTILMAVQAVYALGPGDKLTTKQVREAINTTSGEPFDKDDKVGDMLEFAVDNKLVPTNEDRRTGAVWAKGIFDATLNPKLSAGVDDLRDQYYAVFQDISGDPPTSFKPGSGQAIKGLALKENCGINLQLPYKDFSFTDLLADGKFVDALFQLSNSALGLISKPLYNLFAAPGIRLSLFTPHVERGDTIFNVPGLLSITSDPCSISSGSAQPDITKVQTCKLGYDVSVAATLTGLNTVKPTSGWLELALALRPIAAALIAMLIAWGALTHFWNQSPDRNLHYRRLLPRAFAAILLLLIMPKLIGWGISAANLFTVFLFSNQAFSLADTNVSDISAIGNILGAANSWTPDTSLSVGGVASTVGANVIQLLIAIINIAAGVLMLWLTLLAVMRQFILIICMVTMPIAIIMLLTEGGDRWLKRWLKMTIVAVVLPIPMALLLKIGVGLNPAAGPGPHNLTAIIIGSVMLLVTFALMSRAFRIGRNWAMDTPGKSYLKQAAGSVTRAAEIGTATVATGGLGAGMLAAGGSLTGSGTLSSAANVAGTRRGPKRRIGRGSRRGGGGEAAPTPVEQQPMVPIETSEPIYAGGRATAPVAGADGWQDPEIAAMQDVGRELPPVQQAPTPQPTTVTHEHNVHIDPIPDSRTHNIHTGRIDVKHDHPTTPGAIPAAQPRVTVTGDQVAIPSSGQAGRRHSAIPPAVAKAAVDPVARVASGDGGETARRFAPDRPNPYAPAIDKDSATDVPSKPSSD